MGQYHLICNLTKKEYIHPHALGSGLKLWEQIAARRPGPGAALIVLLACSNGRGGGDLAGDEIIGSWAGDRIAVVGDYAADTDLEPADLAGGIYDDIGEGRSGWVDVTPAVAAVLEAELKIRFVGDGWKDIVNA